MNLYVPIYVTSREFKAKVLLAAAAAERGNEVYLGTEVTINRRLKEFPPGIYYGKDAQPNKVKWFKEVRSYGHRVIVTDEEFIFVRDFDFGHDWFLKVRTGNDTFALVDAFLCPGPLQYGAIVRHLPQHADRVFDTGNARLDLLRPEFIAAARSAGEARRREIGPYILINTNFGEANYIKGDPEQLMQIYKEAWGLDEERLAFFRSKMQFECKIFEHFKGMVRRLATDFPNTTICIRPHPAENHAVWKEITTGLPNLIMKHEGTAIEWSAGALATVHNSCTTGLEAALAGFPVVAFRPETSDSFEFSLPNIVSRQVRTLDELKQVLQPAVDAGSGDCVKLTHQEIVAAVSPMISAYDGKPACDRSTDVVEKVAAGLNAADQGRALKWRLKRLGMAQAFPVRETLRGASGKPQANANNRVKPFQAGDVRTTLNLLAASSGRFGGVACEDLATSLVRIYPKRGSAGRAQGDR